MLIIKKEARLFRPFNFFCRKLKMGNNIIANIIAQSIGITNGDKSLAQKAKTRNTIPN
jgi:hypothetical protein